MPNTVEASGSTTPKRTRQASHRRQLPPTLRAPAARGPCCGGRLTTAISSGSRPSNSDARVAETGRGGGAGPQANAASGVGHVGDRKNGLVVDAGGDCRAAHVNAQDMPLVAVRAEQLFPQIAPLAMHVT